MIVSKEHHEISPKASDVGDRIACAVLTIAVVVALLLAAIWVLAMPAFR